MLDLERARRDTPGCLDKVFLDSAGSSLPPTPVLDAVFAHLRREADVGGYVAAAERAGDLASVKTSIGRLIGASADTIALVDSATTAWNDFFQAVPLKPGDRVLLSEVEYASNAIAVLQRARSTGATVDVIPSDPSGQIDLVALEKLLDDRVRLVSLVHVPTNGGLVNPVREVVDLAHARGALVLLDACQSVGQIALDVAELGVDALSATGRKWLRGPRGTGFLYIADELTTTLEPAALDLHSAEWTGAEDYRMAADASRFEFWECDVAARLGLGAAVDYLLDLGVDQVEAAVVDGAEYLRSGLSEIDGVTVRDLGTRRCGIVSFTVDGLDPRDVRAQLANRRVTVTASLRGSTLLDMSARDLDAVVRASPHYFCSRDDLDRALAEVAALAK
ncbi:MULTISPECIES: aminotransferase class V-fold PLP-dependent enzyme [Rhodococcus]|uniref:Probable hercynylcysteine sulfoxide lyase n=1 Tax=Rhodococcus oxybenzonivorans TaxID=1990687 RepID=A0AAE4UW53_9NOCA|nr:MULTISPECIES: aminotransferase class V-fold PLP-dependent enzyme [Rhodococcus]MDV7243995.1 aminotransferase class V-fold PLP-dependent enzyme [Rhodococcus oxybenzonivorans]MDV7263746.1 aminotransferase class V-fold PLP-dependent enzyme [Rhodococcus oxybenzonivorans]MDV7274763.1 aminotransferase class V-fold PLP-dependent enzyme [Rhodococcus oxybenzonivorans]MDV7335002.1 aminotransferase class V-fold PLP-dependent enzyme [Rhodococcus oxybenzonivorans]MDV7345713.1 aminotransferase class V-fol